MTLGNMTASDITAAAAAISALVAIGALWYQIRRSRLTLGVDLLFKLDDSFNSTEMREKREAAAKSLSAKPDEDSDAVLDFFETIGLLVHRGALDEEMVWHTFFYWIDGYWNASKKYIEEKREKDPEVWRDFESLYYVVLRIENQKRARYGYKPLGERSEKDIREFLEEEVDEAKKEVEKAEETKA